MKIKLFIIAMSLAATAEAGGNCSVGRLQTLDILP